MSAHRKHIRGQPPHSMNNRLIPQMHLSQSEALTFYLFASPWVIGFIVFVAYPLWATIYYSLTEYDAVITTFVGFGNYQELLTDSYFYKALSVTFSYAIISVPVNTAAALLLAVILNQKIPYLTLWRTIYYLPSVISGVAIALLWKWLLNPQYGLINGVLHLLFGIQGPQWLYSERWVLPSYWIISLWSVGGSAIIFLAALQGVPTALYEAAQIDGANETVKFRHITLPLISPVVLFVITTNLVFALRMFAQASVMSEGGRGGPNNASLFLVLYMFRNAFHWSRIGYASAIAVCLFVLTMALTFTLLYISRFLVYNDNT